MSENVRKLVGVVVMAVLVVVGVAVSVVEVGVVVGVVTVAVAVSVPTSLWSLSPRHPGSRASPTMADTVRASRSSKRSMVSPVWGA